jgi:hypothetical protein
MVTNFAANGYKAILTSARVGILHVLEIIEDFPLYATLCYYVQNA